MILNYRTLDLPAGYDNQFDPPGFHGYPFYSRRGPSDPETASVGGHTWQPRIGKAAVCSACQTRASGSTIGSQCAGGAR